MPPVIARRQFLSRACATIWALRSGTALLSADRGAAIGGATLDIGNLKVAFRDNANSPRDLSGIASLVNKTDAPGFDAYDPDSPGASAGLNFEHIIARHKSPHNAFAPRNGRYALYRLADDTVQLVRRHEDDPWAVQSRFTYRVVAPHYIDFDFRCIPHDAGLFRDSHAILFFANYMNDVEDVALHFRGIDQAGGSEKWMRADAPSGHPDWNQGGTYRASTAPDLEYDADHNLKLNSWAYDYPRFTQPFYYGRAGKGMTLILMFDKSITARDAIRFSLFKFKVPRFPRPAWDFQYVINQVRDGAEYGFRGRLVWKRFKSPDDCQAEYDRWSAALD